MPTIDEMDVPFLDIFDPEVVANIQERTSQLLADGHWLVRTPVWHSVLDHDGVRALQKEPGLHTLGPGLLDLQGITEGTLHDQSSRIILSLEGEPHTRLRGLVSRAFTPRAIERLRPVMRAWLADKLDTLDLGHPIEFMADVAEQYPVVMICALVGAPDEDWPQFSAWATSILKQASFTVAENLVEIEAAIDAMTIYIEALVAERQSGPGDDLISALLAIEAEGDRVSHQEVVDLVTALLVAGSDTTRNELGLAMLLFAQHPDQWAMVVNDPTLVPAAVEEVLRFEPTVGANPRIVAEEFTFRDVTFPVGTALGLISGAANRDAAHVVEPNRFDITADRGTFQHLAFGSGPHYCLGASLARAELTEGLSLLAERWATVELAGEPAMRDFTSLYGPITLPLRVGRRA